jgi:hypothetical protein
MFKFTYGHVEIYGRTQNSWMMYTKFGMLLSKHGMGSIPNVYKCTINYHRSSGKSWKVTQGLREISIFRQSHILGEVVEKESGDEGKW